MRNLVLMAGRRWAAEEGNETGKGPIGWDENQLRKFSSLHKHTALVGLAMLRSNVIMDRLAGRRTSVSQEVSPASGDENPADDMIGNAASLRREMVGKITGKELMIPLGDSIVPNVAGEEIPADIGYARLSRNETMRPGNIKMAPSCQKAQIGGTRKPGGRPSRAITDSNEVSRRSWTAHTNRRSP